MRSIRKSIAESDDDATRSSSGGGSSATAQRHIDLSVLRKPILTAVTGFVEAFKAYEAGTEEIRKLLTSECDVLYECRVCRNIFRSLTNFISHKRVYCRKLFNAAQHFHFQNDGFLDQDIATILQAEQDSQNKAKKVHADILNKDLSSIIERLRRKQHKLSAELSMTDYYDKVNHKLTQDDLSRQQHVLQLDRVPTSEAAVFQTVRLGVVDCMRTQVGELDNLHHNNNNTVLGPDGKVVEPQSRPQSTLPVIRAPSEQYFKPIELEKETKGDDESMDKTAVYSCQECNLQFDTEKTLKLHSDMKHTPSTYVYTCPSCPKTFLQPGAVIRHLCNDHKKSMRRIKLMRDSILKRRVRADEVVVKGPSREVSRLLQAASGMSTTGSSQDGGNSSSGMMDHDEAAATRAWMENLEHFDQGPMCSYCGKTFERKAVLSTHMQTCVHKLRQTENGSVPPAAASTTSSSSRRSRTKDEPSTAVAKIKLEPVEPVASDDSNSYDVPLSTLQARITQEGKGSERQQQQKVVERVVTIKPEELALHDDLESSNRRKRKKPMILLRNATDDICWETEEVVEESVFEVSVSPNVPIKQEVLESSEVVEALKGKKAPRSRKKKCDEKEDLLDRELIEKLELGEEIVCRCLKKYNDPEKYKHHLKVFHSRQRRFWCAVCEFKGYRKVDTINHLMQEHKYQGDVEDISSLINLQPVEKVKKTSAASSNVPGSNVQINSIIEAMNRNCDTSSTDISFMEVSASTVTLESRTSSVNISLENSSSTRVPTPEPLSHDSPKKRSRPSRALRQSICVMPPEEINRKPLPPSDDLLGDSTCPTSKRPIRNRVKPVDKDFVYDLTHLLHKEEDLDDFPLPELVQEKPPPPSKPKTESSRVPPVNTISPSKRESLRSHAPKSIPVHLVRGSALKMATRQVELGRAAFHRPPELPQERSFIPSQVTPPRRITTIHDWPVIKKDRKIGSITKHQSDIQIKHRYAKRVSSMTNTLLPELIREKRKTIPRRNSVIPMRQRLSASVEILNKLNASRTAAGLEVVRTVESPVMVKCPTEVEFRRLIEANLKDHRQTMSLANPNGTTVDDVSSAASKAAAAAMLASELEAVSPRKRITLMQRLQENRTKRMQEQNGVATPKEKSSPSTPSQRPESSSPVASSTPKSMNVADMLHAKLKRFSY
ncbi:uncharacterized protein LOC134206139 [Armigeres subalbatus]|uniref:uncharacterized protein LOC134206139 n=1 Tax=Armigeres subalbatus TaxID=124917 RepID=UPI002ED60DDE